MLHTPSTDLLNKAVNRPECREAFCIPDEIYLRLDTYYSKPRNLAFLDDNGLMLFGHVKDDEYEVHFAFHKSGPPAFHSARQMLDLMFTSYGAHAIKGHPPRVNRAVRHLGVALGFSKIPGTMHTDLHGRTCDTYQLRSDEWAESSVV